MPPGKKGRGERIDLLTRSRSLHYYRTHVWETGAALLHYLHYLLAYRGGGLEVPNVRPPVRPSGRPYRGVSCGLPYSRRWRKAVRPSPRLNFTDREHRAMNPSRPASPQSLAMANAKRTYSQYPGGDIYTPPNEPLLLSGINCLTCNL